MKLFWRAVCAATLVIAASAGGGQSQPPLGAPPAPGSAAATAASAATSPTAAAAAEAAPKAGFFKRMCTTLEECRRKLCKTPAGALINNMTKPITMFSGGVIPPFCPPMPSAKDLAQQGVGGAASAAKKDALEAQARRADVRFLGTLDCRYYPEAAPALAAALRTDGSECVRYEAALVLNRGCCCTEITVKALTASVSGTDVLDGAPAERSVRVRCAAAIALERCLSCYTPPPEDVPVADPDKEKEKKKGEGSGSATETAPAPATLPATVRPQTTTATKKPDSSKAIAPNRTPCRDTIEKARQVLNDFNVQLAAAAPAMAARPVIATSGRQSVYQLVMDSLDTPQLVYPASMETSSAHPAKVTPAFAPTPVMMPSQGSSLVPNSPAATLSRPVILSPAESAVIPEPSRFIAPTRSVEPPRAITPSPAVEPARTIAPPTTPPPARMPLSPAAPSTPPMSFQPTVRPEASPASAPRLVPAGLAAPSTDPVFELGKQVLQSQNATDRHAAIRQLVRHDWKQHPMVASVLIAGAKTDPNNVVRVDCMRHLAAYKMNHPQVMADLAGMTNDPDPWVRQEAAQALSQLK